MKVYNKTIWHTADVTRLLRRCIRECELKEGKRIWKHRTKDFILKLRSNGHYGGRAVLGGYWMELHLRKEWEVNDELSVEHKTRLARVMIHEYYHTMGFMEFDRRNYSGDLSKTWPVEWVSDLPVRKTKSVQGPKQDVKMVRFQQALARFATAETRLKRAQTIFRKWKGKVERYQKVYNFKPSEK